MMDLDQIKIVAQLIENLDVAYDKLEKAYEKNDAEEFNKSKKSILNIKNKISETSRK